jgi:hypothetical protein
MEDLLVVRELWIYIEKEHLARNCLKKSSNKKDIGINGDFYNQPVGIKGA